MLKILLFLLLGVSSGVMAQASSEISQVTLTQNSNAHDQIVLNKFKQTLIVPIDEGIYYLKKDKNEPNHFFGFVGFSHNILEQANGSQDYCSFIKQNKAWYMIDQESKWIYRIDNTDTFSMPETRAYLEMSHEALATHVAGLANLMKPYCANINMFPVIEFGYYSYYVHNKLAGWRNLAQSDKSLDKVINWSDDYANEMLKNHLLITYKHYPFSFDDMWEPDPKYCKPYFYFRECSALIIKKSMYEKLDKILQSMPDYSILMYGNYIYVDPDTNIGKIALLDSQWKDIIKKNNFKGLVISDDVAQIINLKDSDDKNADIIIQSWENVDVLMALYDDAYIQKIQIWLLQAYKNNLITDQELNNRLEKINTFNQKYKPS